MNQTDPVSNAAAELEQVLFEIKRVIVGQELMVERLLVALLARGHILLEGLPGVAKTLAVATLAKAIGGSFVRLQFTPDLLPSDLVGTRIWKASEERFDTEWGPVFANLVLTDEINRAPAKVQSALLEVMAERQVSIGGETRPLPKPFLVLATQNPVESEGVYTLPEAQRDRFLMKVTVDYPTPVEELEIVRRMGVNPPEAKQVMTIDQLETYQDAADEVFVDAAVAQYAVDLVMATREPARRSLPELEPLIEFGVSPRATLGLIAAGKALALLRGRTYVMPQDVFDVARDVLRHRLMISYEALAKGLSADDILNRILAVVPAADVSPLANSTRSTPAQPVPSANTPGLRPAATSAQQPTTSQTPLPPQRTGMPFPTPTPAPTPTPTPAPNSSALPPPAFTQPGGTLPPPPNTATPAPVPAPKPADTNPMPSELPPRPQPRTEPPAS